jgi:hypothetical protein
MVYPTSDLKLEEKNVLAKNDFFLGAISCLDSKDYSPNLTVKRSAFEDGKSTIFFLRLREHVSQNPVLTAACLKKNHYYFGNNAEEAKNKKNPVVFHFKGIMNSTISEPKLSTRVASLIVKIVAMMPLEGTFASQMRNALLSYTEVVERQSRTFKISKKGRKTKVNTYERRLPKRIGVSPLLANHETLVIKSLTEAYYGELFSSKPDEWLAKIETHGFLKIQKEIEKLYEMRWKLQERFASLTTNRLKILRVETSNPGLKKS